MVPDTLSRKNPDLVGGFNIADVTFEDKIILKKMYHAGSECRSYVFKWEGDELNVWAHSQCPTTSGPSMTPGDRHTFPRILGIPESKMRVHATFQGGSFGGRIACDSVYPAISSIS